MRKLLLSCALITASGAFFLSSCSKDSNLYDPNQKVNDYNNNWNQQFGAIDPTQNWNVATTLAQQPLAPPLLVRARCASILMLRWKTKATSWQLPN